MRALQKAEGGGSLNLKPVLSTDRVPWPPGPHREKPCLQQNIPKNKKKFQTIFSTAAEWKILGYNGTVVLLCFEPDAVPLFTAYKASILGEGVYRYLERGNFRTAL